MLFEDAVPFAGTRLTLLVVRDCGLSKLPGGDLSTCVALLCLACCGGFFSAAIRAYPQDAPCREAAVVIHKEPWFSRATRLIRRAAGGYATHAGGGKR